MLRYFRLLIPVYSLGFFCYSLNAQTANRFEVVIDELFADPVPSVQLPAYEFIELKNVSSTTFNIRNWKISDGGSTATITTSFVLQPDSFVIICSNSAVSSFSNFGSTIGVGNFPSLNNDGDVISLYTADGQWMHAVAYNKNWYQNAVKSEGGWTLEMIDVHNRCAGRNNWKASADPRGGTPGKKNAVDAVNKDELPPVLYRTFTTDSITITTVFDEPLNSISAAVPSNYTIDNGIGHPDSALPQPPLYTNVVLKLATPLTHRTVYSLKVSNVTDCAGNAIGGFNTIKTGIAAMPDNLEIVINEILFNPRPNGYDFIELYNRSNKIIDLTQLYMATRSATGELVSVTPLSTVPHLMFPGDYRVFTENSHWLKQQYLLKELSVVTQLSSLPSMPDDKGTIVLLNAQGAIIDELHYDRKWHFALINEEQGVSLERVNYNFPTQDKLNWSSASSTAGFGTPGYQNSQLMNNASFQGQISITPLVFSPDNDGWNDFAAIEYQTAGQGYVANIRIFDANGHLVRNLVQNATLAATGMFRWDGLDDNRNKLPVGIYIVLTEIFNLEGKTKRFKQAITLARRF